MPMHTPQPVNPDEAGTEGSPSFTPMAVRELVENGNKPGPEGVAGRHRARTWSLLALANSDNATPTAEEAE